MNRKYYYLIWGFAVILLVLGILLGLVAPRPWDVVGALVAGGGASLLASAVIQIFASDEQTKLLQQLALSAEGIQPIPSHFRSLKWIAHTTALVTREGVTTEWRCESLDKIGETGQNFVVYRVRAKNLVGEPTQYTCTLIGLKACVVAIISLGDETTTVLTFDAPVPAAGIYFGPGYLTDWTGKRNLALAIVGTDTMPNLTAGWPTTLKTAFDEWHKSVNWLPPRTG